MRKAAQEVLSEQGYDVTMEQLFVLGALEEQDGQSLGNLAERVDRDRTTITRMIDGLERKNLVVRVPDQNDNRQKLVYLTRLGRQRMAEVDSLAERFSDNIFGGQSDEDIQAAIRLMDSITRRLEDL